MGFDLGGEHVGRQVGHSRAEALEERLVGSAEVFAAGAVQHRRAEQRRLPGHKSGQPGLADPRLAGDQGDAPGPAGHLRQQLAQALTLADPADEALIRDGRQAGRQRQ